MVHSNLYCGDDGINCRLSGSFFFLAWFSTNEGLHECGGAAFNDLTRCQLGAYVYVLGRQAYVPIGISELLQVRDRVLAYVRFGSGVFRYARTCGANSVVYFFPNRSIRFSGFLENFFHYDGRLLRRVVYVCGNSFAKFRFTFKRFRRAVERVRGTLAPLGSWLVGRGEGCLRIVVLFIACRVGRLVGEVVNGARFNYAGVLNRVGENAVHAGRRFVIGSFPHRIDPRQAVFLLMRGTFLRSFRSLFFSFRVYVKFVMCLVGAGSRLAMDFVRSNVCPVIRRYPRNARLQVANFPLRWRFANFVRRQEDDFNLFFYRAALRRLDCFDLVVLVGESMVIACRVISFFSKQLEDLAIAVGFPYRRELTSVGAAVVRGVNFCRLVTIYRRGVNGYVARRIVACVARIG